MAKQTMGGVIAARRKEQGMTQAELAQHMNVTDKAVSKWERDLSCPDVNSLPRLAQALGITVDELMQVKTEAAGSKRIQELVDTVLRALALAMGVATAVLSILGELEARSAFILLGLGLACLGAVSLHDAQR